MSVLYTNHPSFADLILGSAGDWSKIPRKFQDDPLKKLAMALLHDRTIYSQKMAISNNWKHVFLIDHAERSQFSLLHQFIQQTAPLPDGILCMAGSGKNFIGFKNRQWQADEGNLHICAFWSPQCELQNFAYAFMIIGTLAVIQTIDNIRELNNRAQIKWVNDILIDGAKVAGVLTQTQTMGNRVTAALLGIGINVNHTNEIYNN